MGKKKSEANYLPTVLRLPDLGHSKTVVLNSLSSPSSRRVYQFAINQFIAWYCSESRLAGRNPAVSMEAKPAQCLEVDGTENSTRERTRRNNSLKHGILAKAALIRTGPAKEDEREFNRLILALRGEYRPEGQKQELLVEEIGFC